MCTEYRKRRKPQLSSLLRLAAAIPNIPISEASVIRPYSLRVGIEAVGVGAARGKNSAVMYPRKSKSSRTQWPVKQACPGAQVKVNAVTVSPEVEVPTSEFPSLDSVRS